MRNQSICSKSGGYKVLLKKIDRPLGEVVGGVPVLFLGRVVRNHLLVVEAVGARFAFFAGRDAFAGALLARIEVIGAAFTGAVMKTIEAIKAAIDSQHS